MSFFILVTGQNNDTKQPLRLKFSQSRRQLLALFPTLIAYKKYVA